MTVGLQPLSLRDAVLTIAADDFSAAVTEVTFTPQVEYDWEPTLDGPVPYYTGVRWSARVGFLQDFATPGSLTRYLLEQAAATRAVVFRPAAGGQAISADVMIVPAPLGGPAGQRLTSYVDLPLFGEPALVA